MRSSAVRPDTQGLWMTRMLATQLLAGCLAAAGAQAAEAADVPVGRGHYTTHLRAGGEREPPAAQPRVPPLQRPLPTHQWYSSLLFETWPQPLYAQPGSYRPSAEGFHIDRPLKQAMESPTRDENDIVAMHANTLTVRPDFPLRSARAGRQSDWAVDVVTGDERDAMTVTLAHGSPYSFHRLSRGDASFSAEAPLQVFARSPDGSALGVLAGGKAFGLYAPQGARWDAGTAGTWRLHLAEGARFFSVAVLPQADAATLAWFQRHAFAFITDTHVAWAYDPQRSELTTTFRVSTETMQGAEANTVMGLYPHHWFANPLLPALAAGSFDTVRGPMKLLVGRSFQTRTRYGGVLPFWPALTDPAAARTLRGHLEHDTQFGAEALLGNRGTYWEGKGLNRAAQVMAIAEQSGDLERRDAILAAMKQRLQTWFKPEPNAERYFHYNARVGSLIGYPDEYGSALELNDHHFHYGYWIAAAAQVALRDPAWAAPDQWGGMVDLLVADIATTAAHHPMFPRLRHFDPYEGHGWAAGLAAFYDGNNQESSSEAIHAWAALILWAEATGNTALRDTGIYLYTTEVEAARFYWFDQHKLVFPKDYRNTIAGIVWGNKFVHTTWWTENPREVLGINLLPITAASLYLAHDPAGIQRHLAGMERDFQRFVARGGKAPADIWQDILLPYQALADPAAALRAWDPQGAVEDGETRTHTWHWLQSLQGLGLPRADLTADTPLFAVFGAAPGPVTYLAYNASATARSVRFSDGTVMRVAARSLAQHRVAAVAEPAR